MKEKTQWIVAFLSVVLLAVAVYLFAFVRFAQTGQVLEETQVSFVGGPTLIAEVADDLEEQVLGLSFRENLKPEHGMLFLYNDQDQRLFWMKDMRFAIDIVWISDGVVVGIESNVPPPVSGKDELKIYASPADVDAVLEVQAGYMQQQGLTVGSQINVKDVRS